MCEGWSRFAMGSAALCTSIAFCLQAYAAAGACAQIRRACQDAGFVEGGVRSGNGLKIDCVDPILAGKPQPRSVSLPLPQIDAQVIAACKSENQNPLASAERNGFPAGPANAASAVTSRLQPLIKYVAGSTVKITQLVGDEDKEFHRPTSSRTVTRYGLQGTDLGYSFEHLGQVYFLFGDTVGVAKGALDSIATAQTPDNGRDPKAGVRLDFLTARDGTYLTIQPSGISMGAFEVPVSGISLNGQMYVVVSTNHSEDRSTDRSVLTEVTLPATPTAFRPLRTISQRPAGRFIKMSLHTQTGPIAGLPTGGPFVLMWGTGEYRHSDAYLAIVPETQFESGRDTLYFTGLDAAGAPTWTPSEPEAQPIVRNGTIGDLSVTWCADLRVWLMAYDSRPPARAGVLFSYSSSPWGPWSEPQVIFNAVSDGAIGKFIHDPNFKPDDGLAGPVIGKGQSNPVAVHGGAYAPYVIERWTKLQGPEMLIYYVLSTWNPYVVVLMQSRFQVAVTSHPET
jgi:hypothetical protein